LKSSGDCFTFLPYDLGEFRTLVWSFYKRNNTKTTIGKSGPMPVFFLRHDRSGSLKKIIICKL
jgi:hypothetical protein